MPATFKDQVASYSAFSHSKNQATLSLSLSLSHTHTHTHTPIPNHQSPMALEQQQQESLFGLQGVDDLYFSAQFDDDEGDHFPISDDMYALQLQLQETLMSSVIASQNTIKGSSSSSPPPPQQPPSVPIVRLSSPPPPPQQPSLFRFSSPPPQQPSLPIVRLSSSSPLPQQSSPPIFSFSSSSTPPSSPPSPPPILGFPSSSTTTPPSPSIFRFSSTPTPPPSPPPVFRFTSSSPPTILRFSSSSNPLPSPPILRFPLSSTSSSSRAVKVKCATKTEQMLVDDEQEPGESHVMCEICAETKGCDQMFRNKRCDHSFCSDCIIKQVATKIQERTTVVPCPGLKCKGILELDACRPLLPEELLGKWEDALCEALFLAAPKLYCPFKDCSAMLLDENEGEAIREAECPSCHRLFCARCHVPWHRGVDCELFQSLNKDERGREDLLVRELASQKKWKRCPKCKFYVEKTEGCLHITCRCRFEFCYACGEQWTSTHGGCQRN